MGEYAEAEWYRRELTRLVDEYGEVPPPWVYLPDEHPYSGAWRMGSGETLEMVLGEWSSDFAFDERVAYLHRHPTRPRWYEWMTGFLWGEDAIDDDTVFDRLRALGFERVDEVEEDLERDD